MSQEYSDESRIDEPYALPDVEVWEAKDYPYMDLETGFYYWFCFPGCLPDSEPMGPFETHEEALSDARGEL